MAIWSNDIVWSDRDGDVISAMPSRTVEPGPFVRNGEIFGTLSVTQGTDHSELAQPHGVINSGTTQSVMFSRQEFVNHVLPGLVRRVLGEDVRVTLTGLDS